MLMNDPKGILLNEHQEYTNDTLLYNTTFTVEYYDITNKDTVQIKQINERWGFSNNIQQLGLQIPSGYTDQYFDYNRFNNTTAEQGSLGIQSILYKQNRWYITYNVTPKVSQLKVIYLDINEQEYDTKIYYEPVGTQIDSSQLFINDPNYIVRWLYPSHWVHAFTDNDQTVIIQMYKREPNSHIYIKYLTPSNQAVNDITILHGKASQDIDLNKELSQIPIPKDFKFISFNNPNNITAFPSSDNQPNTAYCIIQPTNNHAGKIQIKFINHDMEDVGSYEVYGLPYSSFNLYQSLYLPKGYSLMWVYNNVSEFTTEKQTIYIMVKKDASANKNSPVDTKLSPGTAYIVYVDEDNDPSLNPETYSYRGAKKQAKAQPVTTIITRSENPVKFNNTNNIQLSDISYNGQPLTQNTLITGPDIYWETYEYDTEYPMMYKYKVDTSYQPHYVNADGVPAVEIKCYPVYVSGITFQFGSLNGQSEIKTNISNLPHDSQSLPSNWNIHRDNVTRRVTYTVPYGSSTTIFDLIKSIYGGNDGQFQDFDGNTYQATDNRTIKFTQPYAYKINVEKE